MTFTLLKDEEEIYNHTSNHEKHASNRKLNTSVDVKLHVQNKSVSFILTGVTASSHGTYRCESIVRYPPPYLKDAKTLRILVLVEGKYS